MIISRTPFRISLFGGGCDYYNWFSKYGAVLVSFAINKHVYISVRPLEQFSKNFIEFYGSLAISKVKNITDIQNPALYGVFKFLNWQTKIHISAQFDIPPRTGLGSSSAFIVGLLNVLYTFKKQQISPKKLVQDTNYIERVLLAETGGIQDPMLPAYGGINSIQIEKNGNFYIRPLPISQDFLDKLCQFSILLYTGETRNSFQIAASHDHSKKIVLHEIAKKGLKAFYNEDIYQIAKLLKQSWEQKKQVSHLISNSKIDILCNKAEQYGALGYKLLGAGGSGFLYCLVEPENMKNFIKNMNLSYMFVDIDYNGSTIIFSTGV